MNKSTDIYTVKNPNSKTNKGGYKIDHKRDYPCHCKNCDKDFRGSASNKAFCSEECEYKYHSKEHINQGKCLTCQKELTFKQLKNNRKFCNISCSSTYNNAQRTDEENARIAEICRQSQKQIMSNAEEIERRTKKRLETISDWSEERKQQLQETRSKNAKIQFENESLEDKTKRYNKSKETARKNKINNEEKYQEYINKDFIEKNFIVYSGSGRKYLNIKGLCEYFNVSKNSIQADKIKLWNLNLRDYSVKTSYPETKIFDQLKIDFPDFIITQSNWDILINPKTNRKLEIDILIKDKDGNIICGVEYNGERFHNKNNPEKENYKSFLCEEKGFKLFHIWTSSKNEDLENLYSFLRN